MIIYHWFSRILHDFTKFYLLGVAVPYLYGLINPSPRLQLAAFHSCSGLCRPDMSRGQKYPLVVGVF